MLFKQYLCLENARYPGSQCSGIRRYFNYTFQFLVYGQCRKKEIEPTNYWLRHTVYKLCKFVW